MLLSPGPLTEACGSRSGDTSQDVVIGDCGVVAAAGGGSGRKVAAGGSVKG